MKQVERFLDKGASKVVAKAKALNFLLPVQRRRLRRLYIHYLKWSRLLRRDPVHQEVMNTLLRFMGEESTDYEEAACQMDRAGQLLGGVNSAVTSTHLISQVNVLHLEKSA